MTHTSITEGSATFGAHVCRDLCGSDERDCPEQQ